VRVAGLYLELLVIPLRLCPFYDWFIIGYETDVSGAVVAGAFALALAAAAAIVFRKRAPRVTLGVTFILVGLLPVSQLVPIIVVAAERFLYLPMLGWCLLVGLGLARLLDRARQAGRARVAVAAVAVLLALYAARTLARVPDWRNDETVNLATAAAFPETPGPYLNLATYYERFEDNPAKALAALAEADKRAPGWQPALARAQRIKAAMASPAHSP
jgi:protein O-mannosyl-transferase